MKTIYYLAISLLFISNALFSQLIETEYKCGLITDTTQQYGANLEAWRDTSLRVGILFVQFADWETNMDARGGVGYNHWHPDTAQVDTYKYRYIDYWNQYFSSWSYIDTGNIFTTKPNLHPDAIVFREIPYPTWHNMGGIRVFGSFRDYWEEVSHKKLQIIPAETHPDYNHPMYRNGIVNNVDTTTGIIQWITLDKRVDEYGDGTYGAMPIMGDAINKAYTLYLNGQLQTNVKDNSRYDKILIFWAGYIKKGWASLATIGGLNCISFERNKMAFIASPGDTVISTSFLNGFSTQAHEFGHLIGFPDLYGNPIVGPYGVGYFCLMGFGSHLTPFLATHINP